MRNRQAERIPHGQLGSLFTALANITLADDSVIRIPGIRSGVPPMSVCVAA